MITRRRFIALSALAVAGAACSKKTPGGSGVRTVRDVIGGRSQELQLIQVGTELLSGTSERVAFGLVDPQTQLLIDGTGRLWAAPDTGRDAEVMGPFDIVHHGDGLPEDRTFFETQVTFPSDGNWQLFVDARQGGAGEFKLAGPAIVKVGRSNDMPKAGEPAISVATPTTADPRGVDPICTRRPQCPLHTISLDDALASGKPVVVQFGTPMFCTSRLCGPELDLLMEVAKVEGERAHFIHVEMYRDDEADTIAAQIRAPGPLAWKVVEEPATYFIGKDKIVAERVLGPADRANFRDATSRLLG